jgi:hypothetical protein
VVGTWEADELFVIQIYYKELFVTTSNNKNQFNKFFLFFFFLFRSDMVIKGNIETHLAIQLELARPKWSLQT